ncbi:hypothetical protein [Tepidibacillus sp. LV47]|uniref:hypothetical protein n=1 Tax=Tepidibacillus sp. LV47 TaxID=3398228 RepID=UPI003AADB693
MNTFFQFGAMYAEIEEGDVIERAPIELGDKILEPGDYVRKIGEKKRTSFEMQDGYYLKYIGKIDKYLLFLTNSYEDWQNSKFFYAFAYVDNNTLVIGGRKGVRDIRVNKLEVFKEVTFKPVKEQVKMDLSDYILE